ncbi:MAG: hypothetical protein PVG71_04030 [Anaerolineae bacterium]|jgi:hypothetical protein
MTRKSRVDSGWPVLERVRLSAQSEYGLLNRDADLWYRPAGDALRALFERGDKALLSLKGFQASLLSELGEKLEENGFPM